MGGTFADSGAFAEYVRTPAELAWPVPEDTLSHEEAATFGCAYVLQSLRLHELLGRDCGVLRAGMRGRFWTAVQALYHPGRLGLVEPPETVAGEEWVYIHGGSCRCLFAAVNK